ncbi:MAG: monovalent cation:proton antiporter-2 (CPA2) family protein [Chitinophagaceae bacterium]|jgi:monovalent cation:proton antiporter-2 (CPA2) family protein|nr:monovalent cation:proton antiporter-2 (CPA2) family protein [Chitinophagaceae bacterium]
MDQQSFLFQAVVYLGAAVVMVPVAKKLGLGSVLGYLLAGILIGPFVLGFIGEEGKDVMHFAEFGVVMMLFLIGLELEPELLWKMRKPIAGLGGLQVLITTLLIMAVGVGFGLAWQQALAVGMGLALSSTAIVLQSLDEKGQMKTAAGESAFAVLLFQDIAVIPMLAVFPLLATLPLLTADGDAHATHTLVEHLPGWGKTLAVLGAVAGIILAGKYLIQPLLRVVAKTRLRELFTASALLLVVGIAVLMQQVGLSPALGTFLAGVILANSAFRHELESDIEPFKGLLLGLFFISVGASIDFKLIAEQPLLIAGLVLGLMLLKALILLVLGKVFNLNIDQNLLFSIALCQMGEFGFVLFAFAAGGGILPQHVVNILIAVVALSMALTPVILVLHEKFIQPRFGTLQSTEDEDDEITENTNPVIIAGFGHFGNTIGRFLRAHHIGTTILDHDSDRVDLLRKLGFKVYYGDATRYDLLHAAGAAEAKLLIIAIDNPEKRLEMVEMVKKHFPQLRMLLRATNRFDAYDLMNEGMLHVYRETLDTALRVGVDTLRFLGYRHYNAQRAARTFLKADEQNLKKLASIRDTNLYIHTAKELIEELEATLRTDQQNRGLTDESGWDEEGLIKEFGK